MAISILKSFFSIEEHFYSKAFALTKNLSIFSQSIFYNQVKQNTLKMLVYYVNAYSTLNNLHFII